MEIRTILLFLWFLIVLKFNLSSKVSFTLALAAILISGIFLVLGFNGFGLRVITYSFGLLTIGYFQYLRELKSNAK
ncbi:hypothetical protein HYW42_02875 [Candidatus Daviesbacteria bacterium]|nr:hypothetical protein [Candidatus Daviesbacteria bacterium]